MLYTQKGHIRHMKCVLTILNIKPLLDIRILLKFVLFVVFMCYITFIYLDILVLNIF